MVHNASKIHCIWNSRAVLKWILLLHLGILPFILSFHTGAFAQDKVRDRQRILNNIQATGMSRVLVEITSPRLGGLSTASQAHQVVIPGEIKTPEKIQAEFEADQELAGEIATTVNGLLGKLSGKVHTVIHRYDTLPLVAIEVSMESLDTLELTPEVVAIFPDKVIPLPQPIIPDSSGTNGSTNQPEVNQPQLSSSVNIIGANTAWSQGYTGSGWYVAILDTGIRRTHQFFFNKAIVEACFASGQYQTAPAGDCPNGSNTMYGTGAAAHYPSNYSGYDHGSHVSGIAAGKKSDGSLNGVAKDANIIAVNVFSKFPSYQDVGAWDSDIIKGLDYIYSLRNTYSIAAVNMSLGGTAYSSQSQCDSNNAPTKAAIDNLRSVGIATVIATGNDGYCNQVSAPGCISSAVAVGASTKTDIQASFNNWNSTLQDLFAPGQSIYSSTGSSDTSFASWSGTSMATPHVTGTWAILRQNRPAATVAQILSSIDTNGVQITTTCGTGLSKPRIQVDQALVLSSPPSVTTGWATFVTSNSATLNSVVNPNGLSTTYYFQWGPTASYGNSSGVQSAGNGTSNVSVAANLTGLIPNTLYHYRIVATNSGGTASGSDRTFTARITPVTNSDCNGDGSADILWRHAGTGQIYLWLMNGITSIGAGAVDTVSLNWVIEGLGDFNGDGPVDILWRHAISGQVYLWLMNGAATVSRSSPATVSDLNWEIEGVGDFNGDGKADILWRHALSGQVYLWLMNSIAVASIGSPTTVRDLNWEIKGVGDFNGDGKADILWRHALSGQVYIWLMDGAAIASIGSPTTVSDLNWEIKGVGDFNGDSQADILWRHAGSGQVYIWLLSGTTIVSNGSPGTVSDLNWQIKGVSDYNGDGKADILWSHTLSGMLYSWLMNGTTFVSGGSPGTVGDGNWKIIVP